MSDHAWVLDHIAPYITNGLDASERDRVEAHTASCERCAHEIAEVRALDRAMEALFIPTRPRPGLEDTVIQRLRTARPAHVRPAWVRYAVGAAAVVLLGILGAITTTHMAPRAVERAAVAWGTRSPVDSEIDFAKKPDGKFTLEEPYDLRKQMFHTLKEREDEALEIINRPADKSEVLRKSGDGMEYSENDSAWSAKVATTDRYLKVQDFAPPTAVPIAGGYFRPGEVQFKGGEDKGKYEGGEGGGRAPKQVANNSTPSPAPPAPQPQDPPQLQRRIIRNGEMEFEIESFDSTVLNITKIVTEEGGFVATVNSEKLPNGKVRGTVVLRVPPDKLDTLLLKLRGLGDLKSQRIGSQDVTKHYTDLESKLRALRAMEERFLNIIKTGKGEIKDLIEAEKQLGTVRTEIEQIEGEIRYYNNLISLSTLTLTLYEQDIKTPATAVETERVTLGIEVDDVEKALRDALTAIGEAKGRVTRSELKKHAADQYQAIVQCEAPADVAGPLRDRLQQLGRVARLDVARNQTTDGKGLPTDLRVKRVEAVFDLSLYNLANVQPRETTIIALATTDVEAAYKRILQRIEKAGGRVLTSSLNRVKNDLSGQINVHVGTAEADGVLEEIKGAGEVLKLSVTENPDEQNVTRSKRGYSVQIVALSAVQPRETAVIQLVTRDVASTYQALQESVTKARGRMLTANLDERDRQNITALLDFDVRRDEESAIRDAMAKAGDVYSRNIQRATDAENVIDSKVRYQITLIHVGRVQPRETSQLGIEVGDVDKTAAQIMALNSKQRGRVVDQNISREQDGRITAKLIFDVPLANADAFVQGVRESGTVRTQQSARNLQVPEGELAIARVHVTLSNAELIVPSNEGISAQIRTGLATAFKAISVSLIMIIVGLSVALPWALIVWGVWKLVRRLRAKPAVTSAGPAA